MKLRSILTEHARLLFAMMLFSFLPACIVVVEKDDRHDDDYYRRRWQLDIIVYGSNVYTPRDGAVYTVAFSNDDILSGRADCVDYEGRYEVGRTSTLVIDNLVSGTNTCTEDPVTAMFLDELPNARSISGNSDELVIHLEESGNLMRFTPN